MAKKSRRVRRKPRLTEAQLVRPTKTTTPEVAPEAAKAQARPEQIKEKSFEEEYHYVVKDLQLIGVLAAAMLGGLIILSFFL